MVTNENRLLALTYITAYLDNDEFQKKAVVDNISETELVQELTEIAVVLATTIGIFTDEDHPENLHQIIKDLREISQR